MFLKIAFLGPCEISRIRLNPYLDLEEPLSADYLDIKTKPFNKKKIFPFPVIIRIQGGNHMSWLKDCIQNVQDRMNDDVEQRKIELKTKETDMELAMYQRPTEFPSEGKVDEVMENYEASLDIFTLVEILIDHGLTTKEEYDQRRKRLEVDLRNEIKKQLMEELPL